MKILNFIKEIYFKFISPTKYAQIIGVKFGINCKFGTKGFGSEPNFIKIGDNFYCSANVEFITHDGSVNVLRNIYPDYKNIDLFKPITIDNNVFIGFGAIILPGTRIGENVVVGAGSVVRGSLKSNSVYAGVPAKYICSIEEYAQKNKKDFINTKLFNPVEKKKYIDKWLLENYTEFN